MKGSYPTTALVALLLAACADGGPTSPRLGTDDSPFAGALSLSEMMNEDDLMRFMGGGIEDPLEGAEPASLASTQSAPGSFTSIDVPGATATRAFGINAVGEIVGSYTDATGTHGYLWANGSVTTVDFPGAMSTEAWGINPRGDIVGRYRIAGDPRTFGFLLRDGIFTDISVPGHLHTLPIKISPSGRIVGCFHDTDFLVDMRGYVQRRKRVRSFELLPSTMHNGVTPNGRVLAGISFESATLVHAYVLVREEYTQFDAPGATFTQAWDISPAGKVVGYFNPVTSHGFVLEASSALDLEEDVGDDDADDGDKKDNASGFMVIDVPGALWTRIFGINPEGDMVGSYADASNSVHGFLLRAEDADDDDADDDDNEDNTSGRDNN
jgi:probable HAF family extracellular repeat protein